MDESKVNKEIVSYKFEDALERATFGIFHYFLILISGISMASIFYEIMSVNFSLPVAECDLNITSKSQYGIVSGSWFAGVILTSHMWGLLSDLYGRRRILCVTPFITFITSVLSSFSTNYWMLAVFRFFNGIFIASAGAIIFAYLGEFLTSRHRSRSIMIASTIFSILSVLLPVIAYLIINKTSGFVIPGIEFVYKPWRLFMFICGLPNLIYGIAFCFFPESPKFTLSQGKVEKTLKILNRIYKINTRKLNYEVKEIQLDDEILASNRGMLRMMLHNTTLILKNHSRSFWLISLIQFGTFYVGHGLLLFFPDTLNQVSQFNGTAGNLQMCDIILNVIEMKKNASEVIVRDCVNQLDTSAYVYVMILQGCYLVGFIIISFCVNFTGRLPIFAFLFFTTGFSGLLIFFVKNAMISTYLYLWLLVSGVASNLLNTVTYDLFPTNLRSMAISTTMLFGRLGGMAGGNVASILLEDNCNWTFSASGLFLIFCGAMIFFIPKIMTRKIN